MAPATVRVMRPTGALSAVRLPRHGFYADGPIQRGGNAPSFSWPEGITRRRRLHAYRLETGLHLRLAAKGFYRGLVKAEGVFGVGRLYATVIRANGTIEHLGLLSTRVITDAGVAFLVDDWDNNGQDITTMNFHGCGTDDTPGEAVGDTALQLESTTVLNPDNTRATGTRSQPAANQYRSVGTLTFDGVAAVVEHGLFSASATGTGTLWDRSVFSVINVGSGDSIQFTMTVTISSGG